MSWYDIALRELTSGRDIAVINRGSSMRNIIENSEKVIIAPVNPNQLSVNEIVLVRIRRNRYVIHRGNFKSINFRQV